MCRKNHTQERYRIFDITATPMGKNEMLVYSCRSVPKSQNRLLTPSELQLLLSCQTFNTLTIHAEGYCRRWKWEQLNNRKRWLGRLSRLLLKYIEVKKKSLSDSDFLVPADIDHPFSNGREDFKNIVFQFGRLLSCWPDIYQAMDSFSQDEILKYITLFKKEKIH